VPSDTPSTPSASRTSGVDSAGARVPHGTDAIKANYGGVTKRTAG
jgi:hypothetical protein